MIYGIAYHSPIDIMTLLPMNISVTLNPEEIKDILITEDVVTDYKAKIQLVFASPRNLFKNNLKIIDQGSWGKILSLTTVQFEKMLEDERKKNDKQNIPNWVWF